MDLTPEEEEIIRRYRQLNDSQKEAVLASKKSFLSWIKTAIKWVLKTMTEAMIEALFDSLRKGLFGF